MQPKLSQEGVISHYIIHADLLCSDLMGFHKYRNTLPVQSGISGIFLPGKQDQPATPHIRLMQRIFLLSDTHLSPWHQMNAPACAELPGMDPSPPANTEVP